jgi:YfiH family protein
MSPMRRSGAFTDPRRAVWFSTGRHGGLSSGPWTSLNLGPHVGDQPGVVAANREIIRTAINADAVVWAELEHGAVVHRVTGPGQPPPADALITTEPGIALAVTAADCAAIAFASAGVIAVAHCGWRGLAAGVIPRTLDAMARCGAAEIEAVIGPAICGSCYPVSRERRDELASAVHPDVALQACSPAGDQCWIDVAAGVRAELALDDRVVAVVDEAVCTVEDETVFSYRRDGQTGRHAMVVVMPHGAS